LDFRRVIAETPLRNGCAGRLRELSWKAPRPLQIAHTKMLSEIQDFYGRLAPRQIASVPKGIGDQIDGCIELWAISDDRRQREALVLLVGLKRNLLPFSPVLERRGGAEHAGS
jgi:hypothetical protein